VSAPVATPIPLTPVPTQRFDGWRIVALGAVAQALAMPLLAAYGIVVTPLIQEFGASATELGIGMSLALLAAALAGPALGAALDRGPLRAIMLAGLALMFVSVFALSRSAALWQIAAAFACAVVGMSMYGMLPVQVVLVNWFVLRRGTALSLAHAGTSVGALLVPTTTAWLIEWLGWRDALVALAGGAALVALPAVARLVKRPEEVGQAPDGIPSSPRDPELVREPGAVARTTSGSDWLRDRNFWLIGGGVGLALSVSVATLFLVRHLETLGIPRTRAALVPSSMAMFGIVGKLTAGWLVDRIDARAVVAGALLVHALGWTIVASQSSYAAMLLASVPLGLGGGGFLPLPPVLQGRCFGRAAIGRIGGVHALIGLPFLLAVSPLVGWTAGRTGGFAAPFFGLVGVLALAVLVLACVRIPEVEPVA
jgi:MFS transporter, OFA family, oxalate/formate antiporter